MEAGFLQGARGQLFYVLHPPVRAQLRGSVLYVHPFAEELNKSRRMVALQARRLAGMGFAVMIPDLHGCGDSLGDFGDARWDLWMEDLDRCLDWLLHRYSEPVIPWGLRLGCVLVGDWLGIRGIRPAATLYWQPVSRGELFLTQFLRLRMAAGMMGGNKETTSLLRSRLDAGETLEVAGYSLSPELAATIATARLAPPPAGPLHWLEVVMGDAAELPPASQRIVETWRQGGVTVNAAAVSGEPFWISQEIVEVPALLDVTAEHLAASL